jgi:glutaconate CoA-transferase subunit B
VRLPGSGGGNDIVSSAKRIVVIMTHEKRKMVKKLDYLTSPGFLNGPGAREKIGLLGGGPSLVVTNLCQMDFDPKTKRIRLASIHPGVTVEQILENTGFDLIIPEKVSTTESPTCEELALLRQIDPHGIYIPRAK